MRGNPITGATYIKRERGPVPKSVVTTLRKLKSEGKISVKEPQYAFDVRRFFSLTDGVDTSAFTDEELGIADAALGAVCATTANRISEMTHDLIWEAAGMGEEIPLYATLAANKGVVSVETMAWAVKESKAWVAQRNAQLQPA